MSYARGRFPIWWMMAAVAAVAVLLAWLDAVLIVALAGLAAGTLLPVALAPSGRRRDVALWAVALLPAMGPVCLYASWVVAWWVLGHRPRVNLDDPKDISPLVAVPHAMVYFSLIFTWPFSLGSGFTLAAVPAAQRRWRSVVCPLLLLPVAWTLTVLAGRAIPSQIWVWFID